MLGSVLLDIRMDGMDVLRELSLRGSAMPVVMLTGHGGINAAIRAMKAGASDFLEQPVEKAVLMAALDDAFKNLSGVSERASARMRAYRALAQALRIAFSAGLVGREG